MSEQCETETVEVKYYLHAEIGGVSGAQEWGPFSTKNAAESALVAMAGRSNVNKVTLERRVEA